MFFRCRFSNAARKVLIQRIFLYVNSKLFINGYGFSRFRATFYFRPKWSDRLLLGDPFEDDSWGWGLGGKSTDPNQKRPTKFAPPIHAGLSCSIPMFLGTEATKGVIEPPKKYPGKPLLFILPVVLIRDPDFMVYERIPQKNWVGFHPRKNALTNQGPVLFSALPRLPQMTPAALPRIGWAQIQSLWQGNPTKNGWCSSTFFFWQDGCCNDVVYTCKNIYCISIYI